MLAEHYGGRLDEEGREYLPRVGAAAGRMGELRARIRPKLVALGADLAGPVEEILGLPSFPHAAQHMRPAQACRQENHIEPARRMNAEADHDHNSQQQADDHYVAKIT